MRDRPTGAGPVGGGGATAALAVAGATSARARRAMGRRMGPPSLREAERRRQRAHPRPGVPIREPRLPSPTMAAPPYRIVTERLVPRCWDPRDAPIVKAAIDSSLDHLRP